jgi:hypothetical protein
MFRFTIFKDGQKENHGWTDEKRNHGTVTDKAREPWMDGSFG